MATRFRSPFAGFPATRQHTDRGGNQTFTVTPIVLTPLRAKAADFLSGVIVASLLIGGVIVVSALPDAMEWHWVAALVAPWPGYHLFKAILRHLFRKKTWIVLTVEEFKFQSWTGWEIFDRQLPHTFSAIRHDETIAERERHDLEIRKAQVAGKIIVKTRYYGDSFHLSYDYLGQRNDVMEIFGEKEARAVRARLTAIDEVLNAAPLTKRKIDSWGIMLLYAGFINSEVCPERNLPTGIIQSINYSSIKHFRQY